MGNHRTPRRLGAATVLLAAAVSGTVHAGEREDLESLRDTTLSLIQTLVEQGWIPKEKADELVRRAKKSGPPPGETEEKVTENGDEKTVRVPYVPQIVRDEIYAKVKDDVMAQAKSERWGEPGALPEWLDRIKVGGDFRMRYQHDALGSDNADFQQFQSIGWLVNNTTENRDRLRLRARLDVEAKVSETTIVGTRVATCQANDPLCIDASAATGGNRSEIRLDRAFLSYKKKFGEDGELKFDVGRFANPFLFTDLVWNNNLSLDGLSATYRHELGQGIRPFGTFGVFPLQDIERSSIVGASSKWLFGGQVGTEWKIDERRKLTAGVGLYDFKHVETSLDPVLNSVTYDAAAPVFRQKGNSLFDIHTISSPGNPLFGIASKFRELDLVVVGDMVLTDPLHLTLTGDFVKNLGYDANEIAARTGLPLSSLQAKTKGYLLRAQVGMPAVAQPGDWQAFVTYKLVERDAVLDAFTDSDFRLGGTDAKGFILGGSYGIDKNTWLTLRWFSAQSASGLPVTLPYSVDTLQLDLNARF